MNGRASSGDGISVKDLIQPTGDPEEEEISQATDITVEYGGTMAIPTPLPNHQH